ncbi:hypothetical protein NDU88_001778 [Pleurodeles waltl]|uniref:Uncharacterized protein n=1 Tax=Pleurodeles waltl TaxID=8319 RepID=A0AAV7T107_PLEWA|nr:hypothetical protein NDU88_001778 [Pleurodeles waltl]
MFFKPPPSDGAQLKCHLYSCHLGACVLLALSALSSSAPSPEPPLGRAAPHHSSGRIPRAAFNNAGALRAQAPPQLRPAAGTRPRLETGLLRQRAPSDATASSAHRPHCPPTPHRRLKKNKSHAATGIAPPSAHLHMFWQFGLAPMLRIIKGFQSGRRSTLKERPSRCSAGHAPHV